MKRYIHVTQVYNIYPGSVSNSNYKNAIIFDRNRKKNF